MNAVASALSPTAAIDSRKRRGRNVIAGSAVLLAVTAVLSLSVGCL